MKSWLNWRPNGDFASGEVWPDYPADMPDHFVRFVVLLAAVQLGLSCSCAVADEASRPDPLPAQCDLRPRIEAWKLTPRQQGARPTCSVFTVAEALEFAAASQRQRGERLSVEYLNWAANQTGRSVRDGGFFPDMWRGFSRHGICAEKSMPYAGEFNAMNAPTLSAQAEANGLLALGLRLQWIKQWNVKTGLSAEEFAAIKQKLHDGWPVCAGLRWPEQEKWVEGVLQMCPPEKVFDGHSVLLVGYRDDAARPGKGVLIFRNPNGGRDGFMSYAYARAYVNDALWIQSGKP